jgi:hypothetical protein
MTASWYSYPKSYLNPSNKKGRGLMPHSLFKIELKKPWVPPGDAHGLFAVFVCYGGRIS